MKQDGVKLYGDAGYQRGVIRKGQGTRDKGQGRRDKGQGTRDKEEGTRKKGQGRRKKEEGRRDGQCMNQEPETGISFRHMIRFLGLYRILTELSIPLLSVNEQCMVENEQNYGNAYG